MQAADGSYLSVATDTYGVQAQSSKKKDAKKVGIASGIGAAVVTSRGDAVVIGSESVITFQLTEPVTVERRPPG